MGKIQSIKTGKYKIMSAVFVNNPKNDLLEISQSH